MGEGARFNMVKKALARQGINADSNLQGEIIVEVNDKDYSVNGHPVHSIGELLDTVEEMI